mmetsp:Transcript_10489/g.27988  ORF Transcript_10489/g.27988 Transcript_10489/m.27988 type:complete len:478 (-) Transcript_10489:99-1532(-)
MLRVLDQAHAGVHLRVHQPEGHRLVADDRLVVRLAVRDDLLLVAPIRERVDDVPHVPGLVRALLQQLDPHVRDGHGQTVVEAEAAVLHGPAQRGHAADVLADGHGLRHKRVDEVVGEHEVDVAVDVGVGAEVLVVASRVALADAVGLVEHARDAVEAEAVEAVLLHPPPHVREHEPHHLVLGVVEDLRVPLGVVPLRAAVGVAVVAAVLLGEAVQRVGGGVRVHQVDVHVQTQAVGGVHQLLQLVRGAGPARRREEGRDVVAEAAVVRVLGHGHELDGRVAQALDAGEHVARELLVRGHLGVEGRHADVRLVDLQVRGRRRPGVLELVAVGGRRLPEDAVEEVGGVVLPRELDPGRYAVVPRAVAALKANLDLAQMRQEAGAIRVVRQMNAPVPTFLARALRLHGRGVLPFVELADEEDLLGRRKPLPVGVAVVLFDPAIDLVALRELGQTALVLLQLLEPPLVAVDAVPDLPLDAL